MEGVRRAFRPVPFEAGHVGHAGHVSHGRPGWQDWGSHVETELQTASQASGPWIGAPAPAVSGLAPSGRAPRDPSARSESCESQGIQDDPSGRGR